MGAERVAEDLQDFEINDIQIVEDEGRWALGVVIFRRSDVLESSLGNADVLTVKVRVRLPEDEKIAGLHEALYRQAVDTITHSANRCEGRSSKELLSGAGLGRYTSKAAARFDVPSPIHRSDLIFQFLCSAFGDPVKAVEYYFADGAKSAAKFDSTVRRWSKVARPRVLEFASGYGCVTRHLAKLNFDLTSSDIHPQANGFISSLLNVPAVQSVDTPEEFPAGGYDVVFALSFFSHMPRRTWGRWLASLHGALNEGGLLIFTTHGQTTLDTQWKDVRTDDTGYWFRNQSEQTDLDGETYGSTVTTQPFVGREVARLRDAKLLEFRPGGWWEHQDLYVVQRRSGSAYRAPFATAAQQARRFKRHFKARKF
jgi:SAM-dependent methyltransferase